MVQYYVHEKELLEAAKAYQLIYDTINKATPEDAAALEAKYPNDRKEAFQNFVLYLLISPYDDAKVDLMKVVESAYPRELEKEERVGAFVRKLLTFELMPIKENEIEEEFQAFDPFKPAVDSSKRHIKAFLQQLCQHNLRVIEKYYSRIRLQRIGALLGVSVERVEAELGDMVVNKRIKARINRLEGSVTFSQRK